MDPKRDLVGLDRDEVDAGEVCGRLEGGRYVRRTSGTHLEVEIAAYTALNDDIGDGDQEGGIPGGGLDPLDADEPAEPAVEGLIDDGLGDDGAREAVEGEDLALQAAPEVGAMDALAGGGEDDLADQLLDVGVGARLLTKATEALIDRRAGT
jgi:hypothetical protein